MPRVTNQDLADSIAALSKRLDAIELEAKVAKWVLRLLGAAFTSIVAYIVSHWKGSK
jgi:hypothetical protein